MRPPLGRRVVPAATAGSPDDTPGPAGPSAGDLDRLRFAQVTQERRLRRAARRQRGRRAVRAAGDRRRRGRGRRRNRRAREHHGALDAGAERARRARALAGGVLRQPRAAELALVGITGTNGKTTTRTCSRRSSRRPASRAGASARIGYRIGGRELDAPRTTPEAPDLQQMLRDMLGRGLRRLRDGGLVARARAAPRRRPALRGGHLHQPDARPPRLPRRHGGLLRREAPAVRAAAGRRARRHQRRRSARRRSAAAAARRPVTYAHRRRRRRPRPDR